MPSPDDIDTDDLLYTRWPLPNGEACHFWLRTAWDFIEEGHQVPSDVVEHLERWGINVPEYIAWVETMIEHFEERPVVYGSLH